MQVFYAPGINGDFYELDERESKHTIRVLRMKEGDIVRLIDGRGNLYEGQILVPDSRCCRIKINSVKPCFEKRSYGIHIAISPLKNPERFEWFVEKSVEIGIDAITPVICKNTEKTGIRQDRLKNIVISAMKQSLKAYEPAINQICHFEEFLGQDHKGISMIAHCNDEYPRKYIPEVCKKGNNVTILIGPEGDFTDTEIKYADSMGATGIILGKSRLRTETAGIVACHSVYAVNQ